MFNLESLKTIANTSGTAKAVFNTLSERERYRDELNLRKFKNDLMNKGEKIVQDEFMEIFQLLQDLGVGALIIGRRGKPNRFKWNYNLKEVAKAATSSKSMQTPLKTLNEVSNQPKRPRGRPRKNQSLASAVSTTKKIGQPISITISLSPNVSNTDIAALLALVNDLNK